MSLTSPRPVVSVIVPTYNYAHLIGQSLESLLGQTFRNWECLVIDDGSTDNTEEVVGRYARRDDRIKYLRQDNAMQAAARNNGLRNSRGDYFQFLDADDLIEERKFERQVQYLEEHPEADIVYGDVRFFNGDDTAGRFYLPGGGGGDKPWMPGISGSGKHVLMALVRKDTIPINTALVRRRVIEKVGVFDERLSPTEDWDFWVRCAAAGMHFHYHDPEGILALVRYHPSSASRNGRRMLRAILLMRRKIESLTRDAEVIKLSSELAAEEEGFLGVEEILHGSLRKGMYQFCRAAVLDKRIRQKAKWCVCASLAPFVSKSRFQRVYSSSLLGSVVGALPQSVRAALRK